jgi:hypothetical protein
VVGRILVYSNAVKEVQRSIDIAPKSPTRMTRISYEALRQETDPQGGDKAAVKQEKKNVWLSWRRRRVLFASTYQLRQSIPLRYRLNRPGHYSTQWLIQKVCANDRRHSRAIQASSTSGIDHFLR